MSIRLVRAILLAAPLSLLYACHTGPDRRGAATDPGASYIASIERIFAAFGSGDASCVDACVAKDFVEHAMLPPGVTSTGRQGLKDTIAWSRKAFPDMRMTVISHGVAGDTIFVHYNQKGTNRGAMGPDMPATGKAIDVNGVDIVRFDENGMAVEHWGYWDETRMMQQLGLAPVPGPAGK